MKKFKFFLMIFALLVNVSASWARETSQAYGKDASLHTVFEHAEYEYFYNNSGGALTSGSVVIFDLTGTGVDLNNDVILYGANGSASRSIVPVSQTNQTTIGWYVTTTTSADSALVAGVVDDDSIANGTIGRFQIYGPRKVIANDSSDAVTSGSAVGTTTVAGRIGGGNGVGVALEAGGGNDKDLIWVFIRPGGNN